MVRLLVKWFGPHDAPTPGGVSLAGPAVYRTIASMRGKRLWWPALKALIGLAILVAVGWRFAGDLRRPELWQGPLHPGWLALSGLLYLSGLAFWAVYWWRLLGHLGPRPPFLRAARAYYVSQLGKYVPGKAWALLLRAGLVRGTGVELGVATLTTFYEVLVTMTSGALLAALLFTAFGLATPGGSLVETLSWLLRRESPEGGALGGAGAVALALLLAAVTGLPAVPGIFNALVHRLSLPFRSKDDPAPRVRTAHLAEGLALTAGGWLFLGAALAATLAGVRPDHPSWGAAALGRLSAIMAVAYVAGFVLLIPGGLGVREFFLALLLVPELTAGEGLGAGEAGATVFRAALALRVVWTAAEALVAGVLYRLPLGGGET
jgi:glycosyltransferase 2 family protein